MRIRIDVSLNFFDRFFYYHENACLLYVCTAVIVTDIVESNDVINKVTTEKKILRGPFVIRLSNTRLVIRGIVATLLISSILVSLLRHRLTHNAHVCIQHLVQYLRVNVLSKVRIVRS